MKMSLKRGILFTLSFSLAVLSVPVSTFAEEIESADETLQIIETESVQETLIESSNETMNETVLEILEESKIEDTEETVFETVEESVLESVEEFPLETVEETSELTDAPVTSGTHGDNLTWTLSADGTLTISGNGAMKDENAWFDYPWDDVSDSVKKIIIKNGVTTISGSAFYRFSNLSSVTIANSVTYIDFLAFAYCPNLSSVTIPGSVTTTNNQIFENCPLLKTAGPIGSGSNIEFGWTRTIPENAFGTCSYLTTVSLPNTITGIGHNAFSNCKSLSKINIPSSVTTMSWNIFGNCPLLKTAGPIGSGSNIEFGWTEKIPNQAFDGCSSLSKITFPKTITAIGDSAFYNCTGLTNVTLPNGLTTIGSGAFHNCSNLKNPVIPSTVSVIDGGAFSNCTSITKIVLPNGIKNLWSTFSGCSNLKEVTLPSSLEQTSSTFSDCNSLSNISLPNTLQYIGFSTFKNCTSLKNIRIPSDVSFIETDAFMNCTSLESITLPNTVNGISESAFEGCTNLRTLNFSSNVRSIGTDAFLNCPNLKNITLYVTKLTSSSMIDYGDSTNLRTTLLSNNSYLHEHYYTYKGQIRYDEYNKYTVVLPNNKTFAKIIHVSDANFVNKTNLPVSVVGTYVNPENEAQVREFVSRFYETVLGRAPEEAGLAHNSELLLNGSLTASELASAFFESQEYINRKRTNAQIVNDSYNAILGRNADAAGAAYWQERLAVGMSPRHILYGFCQSVEFGELCQKYGVKQGTISLVEYRDQNYGITAFASRMYTQCLGRAYDIDGLNNWAGSLVTGSNTATKVGYGFFTSTEYLNKKTSNERYITDLYHTIFGREPDAGGKADWLNRMNNGATRDDVYYGFANSAEFAALCAEYGVKK